jgi:type IV pilus assembly protein PilW
MMRMSYPFPSAGTDRRKPRQLGPVGHRGFTLVELMISVTLGLLIVIALVAVYLNISRTNTEMSKTNGLIENGRFSIDLLEEDISHAGFWGGYVPKFDDTTYTAAAPGDAPTDYAATLPNPPDPCLAYANWAGTAGYAIALTGIPVQAYDASPSSNCSTLLGTDIAASKQANTDVLVVRHADNCLPGVGSCDADTLANAVPKVYFQASFCAVETENTPPYRFVLSNTPADFTLKKRGCTGTPPGTVGTAAERRKYVSNMYFVRNYAVNAGDGIPTLMRSTFGIKADGTAPAYETPASVVEGVQGFAVEIGIDAVARCGGAATTAALSLVDPTTCAVNAATAASNTLPVNRGDGVPESFVRCTTASPCTNAQLQNATAVKVWILARSRESSPGVTDDKVYCLGSSCGTATVTACPAGTTNAAPLYGPFCDGYKRHVFQTTIRLTNVSGRRETP